jgi:hypothetical protein
VKCTEVDPVAALNLGGLIIGRARADLAKRVACEIPDFPNAEYWFTPHVAAQLTALARHIQSARTSNKLRSFLWVYFSSLILAKESVANARDIIH